MPIRLMLVDICAPTIAVSDAFPAILFMTQVHPDKLPAEDKGSGDEAFKRVNDAAIVVEKQIRSFRGF